METDSMKGKYESMCRLLLEDEIYRDPAVDFCQLCSLVGARPEEMQDYLDEELGMQGPELLAEFRLQSREGQEHGYGRRNFR